MTSAPHILVLPTWYPNERRPDFAVYFRVQSKALQDVGAKVGVIFPEMREAGDWESPASVLRNHFQISEATPDGYPVIRWHGWRPPKLHDLAQSLFCQAAERLYRRYVDKYGRPDIILAHTAINAGVAAQRISHKHNVPYVIVEHSTHFARGLYSDRLLAQAGACFKQASEVFAVSETFRDHLQAQFHIPVQFAPNAVDTTFFSPDPDIPHNPSASRALRLAFVGTMDDKKGVDILMQACADLAQVQQFDLRLIGEGPALARYQARARDSGISSMVTFMGAKRQTAVRDLMRWADLFVLPSRFETFGVVVIEALATGTPVVVTRCGGPETIVTDPRHGDIVDIENPRALAQAIRKQGKQSMTSGQKNILWRNQNIAKRFGTLSCARSFITKIEPLTKTKVPSETKP